MKGYATPGDREPCRAGRLRWLGRAAAARGERDAERRADRGSAGGGDPHTTAHRRAPVRAGDVLDAAGAARPHPQRRRDVGAARRDRGRARARVREPQRRPRAAGVPFLDRAREWLGPVAAKVRLVAIDQRGTGANALRCPALQREMGASDLTPPTPAAVTGCARGWARTGASTARRTPSPTSRRCGSRWTPTSWRSTAPPTGPTPRSATRSPTPSASAASCSTPSCRSRTSACSRRCRCRPRAVLGEQATKDVATVVRTSTTALSCSTCSRARSGRRAATAPRTRSRRPRAGTTAR